MKITKEMLDEAKMPDTPTARKVLAKMLEEDDDIQDYKKPWVNLSDSQLEAIYYEVVAEHRGAPMPWGQVVFAKAVQARLRELNT